jgi:hypothetical protein
MTIEEQDSKGNIERNKSLDSIKSDSSASTVPNAAVDYVIAYRFPLKPTGSTSKQHLESTITSSMNELTTRLTKVGLRFQVRTGKEPGTLFILVSSPIGPIRHLYQQQRRRDFLLGVRVNDINSALDSSFEDSITEGERLHLVYELLTLPETDGGAGVSNITDEYIQSIFPLHDEEFNKKWIKSWSHKWKVTDDDLLKIRDQFGEKIAYYFAFLQNYLVWLGAPAALGILVYLTHSNTLAIWYSLSMLVWSILFIEIWERREQELAVKWGVRNYTKHEKNRNEYKGDSKVRDEVTGDEIPFVSVWKLLGRRLAALPGVIVSALFLSLIVGFVFVLQIFLHEYYNGPFHQILHFAPTVGYVLFIPTMTGFYSRFVKSLNNWEMHKTDALWDYHYTQKIFIANFLVGYLSLVSAFSIFYIQV